MYLDHDVTRTFLVNHLEQDNNISSIKTVTNPISLQPNQLPQSNIVQTASSDSCPNNEKAYLAVIITVLPLWAILTTLIIFLLLSFHKNLRATKVYDNCNKNNANYTYYIELRTGDTSSTYLRRKTTLTIDMFDDNQTTLARIAVPGHVIFGRKESPIGTLDDEKFSELRVTRFWLYRSAKLNRVSTIRLTHTSSEPEAKIMVYAIEIRSNERDKHKLFFPVMSYISSYGASSKPNASFDLELIGSISNIGGSQDDTALISQHLSWVDYILLVYFLVGLIFLASSFEILAGSFKDGTIATYKGAIIGSIAFAIIFMVGIIFRYLIKHFYSLKIGIGSCAIIYYLSCAIILIISSTIWIYTTVIAYKQICPEDHPFWVLSVSVAVVASILYAIVCSILNWVIQVLNPKYTEQYVIPDDITTHADPPSKNRLTSQQVRYSSKQQMMQTPMMTQQPSWHMQPVPMQIITPHPAYAQSAVYGQPVMINPMMNAPMSYKTLQTGYTNTYEQQPQHGSPQQPYQQQQSASNTQVNLQGIKASPKKVGSSESTGSTYYQQLMKNKGGVKSISQYGELLKSKKVVKK